MCPLACNREDEVDAAFLFLQRLKLESVIKEIHVVTLSQNSLKEWGPIKATTITSVGLPPQFATFSSSSAAGIKVSILAALGALFEATNTGAEAAIVDIRSSSERTKYSVCITARLLKAVNLAS